MALQAKIMRMEGDLERAETEARKVLKLRQRHLPPEHSDIAFSWVDIADIERDRGQRAQERTALTKAAEILRTSNADPDELNEIETRLGEGTD